MEDNMNYEYYNPFTSPRRTCCGNNPNFLPCNQFPHNNFPNNIGCNPCDNQFLCDNQQPIFCNRPNSCNNNFIWLLSGIMIGKLLDDC